MGSKQKRPPVSGFFKNKRRLFFTERIDAFFFLRYDESSEFQGKRMIGMTGFASVRVSEGPLTVDVKIKAYNNRYFDLKLMLPSELEEKEWEIRRLLSQKISRGRVEAAFLLTKEGEVLPPVLNEERLSAYAEMTSGLRNRFPNLADSRPESLLRLPGVLEERSDSFDVEEAGRLAIRAAESAVEKLNTERRREGAAAAVSLAARLDEIESGLNVFRRFQSQNEEKVKESIGSRFREVLGNEADCDRFYQETAAALVRFSVNEEIERLTVHLSECRRLLTLDEPVGKRLDFLAQEINREANTAASKALFVEMTQAAVLIKDALENFREQARNIE